MGAGRPVPIVAIFIIFFHYMIAVIFSKVDLKWVDLTHRRLLLLKAVNSEVLLYFLVAQFIIRLKAVHHVDGWLLDHAQPFPSLHVHLGTARNELFFFGRLVNNIDGVISKLVWIDGSQRSSIVYVHQSVLGQDVLIAPRFTQQLSEVLLWSICHVKCLLITYVELRMSVWYTWRLGFWDGKLNISM